MDFVEHYDFGDEHAFLSPSNYHWVNYNKEKLEDKFRNWTAAKMGTRLHAFAQESIELGIKLPRSQKTINMFVNDAIGFRMMAELGLFYSDNCFGTVDAISFRRNLLRIHDYKSGRTKASMTQLEVYASIFCLQYNINPNEIEIELRIYQNDEIVIHHPEQIRELMDIIIHADKHITSLK